MSHAASKAVLGGALLLLALAAPPAPGDAAAGGRRQTLAVLPCSDEVQTIAKFHPLVTYLAEATGVEFTIAVPTSAAEFDRGVKNGDFAFVLQDPNTYVASAGFFQRDSLLGALDPDGETVQYGVVIARKDRGIRSIADLRGKDVMFGNELSAAKWAAARDLFAEHGIDIERDLRSHPVGGCCEDIAFNVSLGAVDAGVVCGHFLGGRAETQDELGVRADALMVVARTRPVPERVFAAHAKTERALVEKVAQALLRLDRSDPALARILTRAELGGFRRATDAEYDVMRVRPGKTPRAGGAAPPAR